MRFTGPKHISSVDLSTGPCAVTDGVISPPDDATVGDLAGLRANGFELADAVAPVQAPVTSDTAIPATSEAATASGETASASETADHEG